MEKLISLDISNTIINIPGILGLASLDFAKTEKPLIKKDYLDSISVEINESGNYSIKVSVIISIEIMAKMIIKEVTKAINNIVKKTDKDVDSIDVYIRGVQ